MEQIARAKKLAEAPPRRQAHGTELAVKWPEGLWPGYQDGLLDIFRMIDDDDNGAIDFGELLDLGKGVSESFDARKCYSLLGRMDDDRDGSVTRTEFLEFFGKMMKPHTSNSNDKGMVQIRTAAEDHVRRREALRSAAPDGSGAAARLEKLRRANTKMRQELGDTIQQVGLDPEFRSQQA